MPSPLRCFLLLPKRKLFGNFPGPRSGAGRIAPWGGGTSCPQTEQKKGSSGIAGGAPWERTYGRFRSSSNGVPSRRVGSRKPGRPLLHPPPEDPTEGTEGVAVGGTTEGLGAGDPVGATVGAMPGAPSRVVAVGGRTTPNTTPSRSNEPPSCRRVVRVVAVASKAAARRPEAVTISPDAATSHREVLLFQAKRVQR